MARRGKPFPLRKASSYRHGKASTWNLAALSPIVKSYTLGVGKFKYYCTRDMPNAWLQDDWAITSKLTLNLGVRDELIGNAWANSVEFLPWLTKDRPDELRRIHTHEEEKK